MNAPCSSRGERLAAPPDTPPARLPRAGAAAATSHTRGRGCGTTRSEPPRARPAGPEVPRRQRGAAFLPARLLPRPGNMVAEAALGELWAGARSAPPCWGRPLLLIPPPPPPARRLCSAQRGGDGAGGPGGPCLSALPMWVSRWGRERAGRCCCRWCCTHTPCATSCPPPSWWARRPPTCWPGAPGACSPPSSPPASTGRWTTASTPSTRAWCSSSSRTTRACRWAGGAARGSLTAAGGERREAALSPPRSPGAPGLPPPPELPPPWGGSGPLLSAGAGFGPSLPTQRSEGRGSGRSKKSHTYVLSHPEWCFSQSPGDTFVLQVGSWRNVTSVMRCQCSGGSLLARVNHAACFALRTHGATLVVDKNIADYNCTSYIYVTLLHLPTSVVVYLLSGLGLQFWISPWLWLFSTSERGAWRLRLRRQTWQSVLPYQRVWLQVIMLCFTTFSSHVKCLQELNICLWFVKQIRRLLIQYSRNS